MEMFGFDEGSTPFQVQITGAEKVTLSLITEDELKSYFSDATGVDITGYSELLFQKYLSHKLPLAKDRDGELWQVPLDSEERPLFTYKLKPSEIIWQARRWLSDDVRKDPERYWNVFSGLKILENNCSIIEKNREKKLEAVHEKYRLYKRKSVYGKAGIMENSL